jgi:hypothetical protein
MLAVFEVPSVPAGAGRVTEATSRVSPSISVPLAGSVATAASASAVVVMGKDDGQHDLFWELFGYDSATSRWKLITPPGVADNGGLMVAQGNATNLLVGFGASQGLAFSPVALSSNGGKAWSPGGLAEPLATAPSAIALGENSSAVALVDGGREEVLVRAGSLTSWATLTTESNLAGLEVGKMCGVQSIGAVAIRPGGQVLVGASCRQSGVVGVFANSGASWSLMRVPVGDNERSESFATLRLTNAGGPTTGLFSGVDGATRTLLAGWAAPTGGGWTLSAPLVLRAGDRVIASGVGSSGSQFVLLRSGGSTRAEIISSPSAAWKPISPLPAGTATIATQPGGQLVALSVSDAHFTVWQVGSDGTGWKKQQSTTVPIAFGSSD